MGEALPGDRVTSTRIALESESTEEEALSSSGIAILGESFGDSLTALRECLGDDLGDTDKDTLIGWVSSSRDELSLVIGRKSLGEALGECLGDDRGDNVTVTFVV